LIASFTLSSGIRQIEIYRGLGLQVLALLSCCRDSECDSRYNPCTFSEERILSFKRFLWMLFVYAMSKSDKVGKTKMGKSRKIIAIENKVQNFLPPL